MRADRVLPTAVEAPVAWPGQPARPVVASRRSLRRRLVAPAGVALAAAAGLAVIAAVDPNEPGHYPVCPFLAASGLYCPGCGTLRALHALTHGDLATGFARNPMTMLTLPFLLYVWAAWVVREVRGTVRTTMAPAWWLWALAGAEIAFWVLRNLPGFGWLAP